MRISKIFRKYSRVLLLVFMSLLLVVFLVGDVVGRSQRGGAMRDFEIGSAFGEAVFNNQIQQADADYDLAARLGFGALPVYEQDTRKRGIALHLLMDEARRAGIRVSREEIIQQFHANPQAAAALDQMHKRGGRSLNSIYDTLGRVRAAMVMADQQARASIGTSLPQLEQFYRDQNQEARVLVSVIDSKAFLREIAEPTEQELQTLFDEARNRDTAHTEDELVFGYRLPDRVQIEYLTIDPAEIAANVRVREKEAERYYEDNKHRYMKTIADDSPFKIDEGQPQRVQMTYEEARDKAREDCRMAKALRETQSLINLIQQEAARPWIAVPTDADGKRPAPADDQILSFTDLQERFSTDYAVSYHQTDLVDLQGLSRVRGFARASAAFNRRPVSAPNLAFRVEGLASADDGVQIPVLQVGEPSPVVIEQRPLESGSDPVPYQAYVFRVIQVAPAGPPESLDDVRPELVSDAKKLKALELAAAEAEKLAARAREVGLTQAVADASELRAMLGETADTVTTAPADPLGGPELYIRELGPEEPKQFLRMPTSLPNVGRVPGLNDAVFALADDDNGAQSEHRVVSAPAADRYKWTVAELLEVKPIYQADFDATRDNLERQIGQYQARMFVSEWFSADKIFQRAGFVATTAAGQQ